MQLYTNNIQDRYGNALKGALITVKTSAGDLASLYSDNGVTVTSNPLVADATGEFFFYAANGRYTFTVAATGMQSEIISAFELRDALELQSIVELGAASATASAATATAKADQATASQTAAANSEGNSLANKNAAALSATNAATSEGNALSSKNAAAASFANFDARYLGAKAVAPTLDNAGAALQTGAIYFDTVISGGSWRVWSGSVWVTLPVANASSVVNTPAGTISATTVQGAINEIVSDFAASSGASLVGYNAQFLNAVTSTMQSKAQEHPSVFDYMTGAEITAVQSGSSDIDVTASFQKALTAMSGLSSGRQRYLEVPQGLYPLTQIKMEDMQDVAIIMQGAKLNAIGMTALDSLVQIVNTQNFKILGSWAAYGGNRTNYEALVHCTAKPGGVIEPIKGICTTTDIYGLVGNNAKCVLQLGDYSKDDVISEINVYGLQSHSCPTVVHAGGSQTGATFTGCTLTSEANAVINTVPGAAPEVAMWLEGGFYTVNGGEILHLLSTANETIRFNPCQSATYSSPYPMLRMNGVHFECAAIPVAVSNIRGIAGPTSNISQISLLGCGGYMNPSIAASNLIDVLDATYAGRIQVFGGNFYSQVTARTAQNIGVVAGAQTLIDTDASSFGAGHKHWLGGTTGGKVLHDPIAAVSASNLNNQSVASGTPAVLKWITNATAGVFGRYSSGYSAATGVFTVPAFGVTSLRIGMSAAISTPGAGYVEVLRNGVRAAIRTVLASDLSVDISYAENDVPAGTTYSVKLTSTGAGPIAFAASATDFLTVTLGTN